MSTRAKAKRRRRLKYLAAASVTLIALGGFVSLALQVDPEVAKQKYVDSGHVYFAQQQYAEAAIQYRNAIQQDPLFGEARSRLAETYLRLGDFPNAYAQYIRAADLLRDDHDLQLKAASLLLAGGRSEDARTRAQQVLTADPSNTAARILLGNAMAGLNDLDGAIAELYQAIALDPTRTQTYANLGVLQYASGDWETAESMFTRAVEIAPGSIDVYRALGNYYWAVGRFDDAEAALIFAVNIDQNDPRARRSLATFYLITGRFEEAEPHLKVYAEASDDVAPRLRLADYYIAVERPQEAIEILESLTAAGSPTATGRLAAVLYDRQPDRAHQILDDWLRAHPADAVALTIKARLLLSENRIDPAIERAEAAVAADPEHSNGHFALGLIYAAAGDVDRAIREYNETLRLNPRAAVAQYELSRLFLATGDSGESVELARSAVQSDPGGASQRLLLASGLMTSGDFDGAQTEIDLVEANLPDWAAVHTLKGRLQYLRGEMAPAARSFQRALELQPEDADALAGLVAVDAEAGEAERARARVEDHLTRRPDDPGLLMLAARTLAAENDAAGTEEMLKRAIETDPSAVQAYLALGRLYALQGRLDEAVVEFERVAARQPDSVTAPTMIGMIFELQNDQDEARKWYERILDIDRRSPIAANNLAWIYANSGENLDVALSLAQVAKEQWPDEPGVSDTLGWIYYKKELVSLAAPLFEKCVEQEPSNPVFHYHLGLVRLDSGDEAEGRAALERALALEPDFDGAAEARQALAALDEPAELQ